MRELKTVVSCVTCHQQTIEIQTFFSFNYLHSSVNRFESFSSIPNWSRPRTRVWQFDIDAQFISLLFHDRKTIANVRKNKQKDKVVKKVIDFAYTCACGCLSIFYRINWIVTRERVYKSPDGTVISINIIRQISTERAIRTRVRKYNALCDERKHWTTIDRSQEHGAHKRMNERQNKPKQYNVFVWQQTMGW